MKTFDEEGEEQAYKLVEMLKQTITKGKQLTPEEQEQFDKILTKLAQKNIVID